MPETPPARRYRFGTFEADTATGELRRQGLRVRLNAQPFQVLVLLLERPGEVLTREEIERALWPDGTVVDFTHGVNSAINRIREALGDTAANPRFIETLARRGYRFVAPVERISKSAQAGIKPENSSQPPAISLQQTAQPAPATSAEHVSPLVIDRELEAQSFRGILATPQDLPKAPHALVQTLFILLQIMYLGFYIGALSNLAEIIQLLSPMPRAGVALAVLVVTAVVLIPVRTFTLCAALFRAPRIRQQFLRLWPFLLVLDVLWALSPFLLLHHIDVGVALVCMALLVYSPFAQRSLILMGAGSSHRGESPAGQ